MRADPGGPEMEASRPEVRINIRFERFPVSIKGAFVARGADGNPHGITFRWARVRRIPSGPERPIPTEDRMLDVAPNHDLFVPFEVPLSDLDPGWYEIRALIRVDAGKDEEFAGRPFCLGWTRNEIRRGTFPLNASVRAGGRTFLITRVDLGVDAAVVTWREGGRARPAPARGPGEDGRPGETDAEAVLIVGDSALERLPPDASIVGRGVEAGERRSVSYPVPRSARFAAVAITLASGERSQVIELRLA